MGKRRGWKIFGTAVLSVCLLIPGAVALASEVYLSKYRDTTMDLSLLNPTERKPSCLYAYDPAGRSGRSGEVHLYATLTQEAPSFYCTYEDMPDHLIRAFVAIEDKRFFRHHGVDVLRTVRAGVDYLLGRGRFGGSTITQQLVKNLTGDDEHTPERKCREMFAAWDLERHADKTRILEAYLNVINLSNGCFGVGQAAYRYFSKPVQELSLSECAVIAAVTNQPAVYNPLTHPEETLRRRNLILNEMADQGYISEEVRNAAAGEPLNLRPSPLPAATDTPETTSSWYTDMVVQDVLRDLETRLGLSAEQAHRLLFCGELSIYIPIDEALQTIVGDFYRDSTRFPVGEAGRPQSAFVLLDPFTGDVLAVAGGVGEKPAAPGSCQNYAVNALRPSGSVIKPLSVYAPALEKGLCSWSRLIEDAPVLDYKGEPWPHNADGVYRGQVTVRDAVADSLNTVAVKLLREVGAGASFRLLHDRLGLTDLCAPCGEDAGDCNWPSLALGQHVHGVTVRDLTAAYTIFENGVFHPPVSYTRVLDRNGTVLLENPLQGRIVLSEETAAVMTKLMEEVVENGTASGVTLPGRLGVEAAGKTGTTQDNCDRWFVGYTPRLLAGVWTGYEYPMSLHGIEGNPSVRIWDELMTECERAYRGSLPCTAFPIPPRVIRITYCPLSGYRPAPDPVRVSGDGRDGSGTDCPLCDGWYVAGTEPKRSCPGHPEPSASPEGQSPEGPSPEGKSPEGQSPDTPVPGKSSPGTPQSGTPQSDTPQSGTPSPARPTRSFPPVRPDGDSGERYPFSRRSGRKARP